MHVHVARTAQPVESSREQGRYFFLQVLVRLPAQRLVHHRCTLTVSSVYFRAEILSWLGSAYTLFLPSGSQGLCQTRHDLSRASTVDALAVITSMAFRLTSLTLTAFARFRACRVFFRVPPFVRMTCAKTCDMHTSIAGFVCCRICSICRQPPV